MTEDAGAVGVGFVRQRRNVIGVSLALVFYETSGLIVRKLSFFGNEADVANPTLAGTALWIALAYFGVRYTQYYHDLPDKGVRKACLARMRVLIERIAKRIVVRAHRQETDWKEVRDLKTDRESFTIQMYPGAWHIRLTGIVTGNTRKESRSQHFTKQIVVSGPQLRFVKLKSFFYVGLCTRFFTEYYLPFAVAFIPIVLWVCRVGPG